MTVVPETFETERLYLRRARYDDAEAVYHGYASDPEVTRFMTWRTNESLAETESFLAWAIERWDLQVEYTWSITWKGGGGECIGMVAYRPDGHRGALGYVLRRSEWRKGVTTEAVTSIADWLFQNPQFWRLWAVCDVANLPSQRVMEKVGMVREGLLRRYEMRPNLSDVPGDCYLYAKVRE